MRERREDIPLLAREMLRRRLAKDPTLARFFTKDPYGQLQPRISGRLVDFLVHHELPGNTRELDSLLAAAIAHSPGDRIAMFPGAGASPSVRPPSSAPVSSAPPSDPPPTTKGAQVEERIFTTEVVLAAIKRANGNLTLAAKILDTERTKLYRIMKKLGIKIEEE